MIGRFLAWFGTNEGRIVAAAAIVTEIGAAVWNMHLHAQIELGSLGGGLSAILGGSAALLAAPPAVKALNAHLQLKLARKNDDG